MSEAVMSALITGGLALAGVVITVAQGNKKIETELKIQQAVTDTKIDELTREVREHNNFARRVPLLEKEVEVINHRIKDLEKEEL